MAEDIVERLEFLRCQPNSERSNDDVDDAMETAAERITALRKERDELREALQRVGQWAESYPIDIFPEPDLDAVNAALASAGIQNHMDRMHSSWARYLTKGIGGIARAALGNERTG